MFISRSNHPSVDVPAVATIGDGPEQIIFLHGFAASRHTWDDVAPHFDCNGYTLHLLDLKGHGESPKPGRSDYSPIHQAAIVVTYINEHQLSDITIIGHSLGGLIALLTVMDCPAISRIVLIGALAFPQDVPRFMRILRLPVIGPLLMTIIPARIIARKGLETAFHKHDLITNQLVDRYAAGFCGLQRARALAETVRQLLPASTDRIIARYSEIKRPTLLIWGEHDRVIRLRQGERLHAVLSDSILYVIPDCGHNPHEERPEETFRVIHGFLAAHA